MFPGDAPLSFPSAGMTGPGQQQHKWPANSQIQAAGDVYNQPPSYDSMDHGEHDSQKQFQDGIVYRGLDRTAGIDDNTKAPSFTGLGYGQGNSYNSGGSFSREVGGNSYGYGSGSQPLSIGAMAKGSVSQTSGNAISYSEEKAPNLSDVNRRATSQTGEEESLIVIDDPDAEEYVGMSLVGKNFRKFYPNAYYREKDDEN